MSLDSFRIERTIQCCAFLLRREPDRRMSILRLLSLLYIAERELMLESNYWLTGSNATPNERGPRLERVYELIHGHSCGTARWAEHFRTCNYWVQMTNDPDVGHLSRCISNKLEDVARRHEYSDDWLIAKICSQLPEAVSDKERRHITIEERMECLGMTDTEKDSFREMLEMERSNREFFGPESS